MKPVFYFILFIVCAVMSLALKGNDNPDPISFEDVNLGKLRQGDKREVTLKGKNNTDQKIEVENVINQMTGGENFRFPQFIKPHETFKIQFTLNTKYMEGDFSHNIVLITPDGKPHVGVVSGVIENPIIFSERYLDLGYYSQSKPKEWFFYVWGSNNKPLRLRLSLESQKEFAAVFAPVNLNVENFDNIQEGGKTPALKVKLMVKKLEQPANNQKSIRKLVSFVSEDFVNATPEIMVTGYWE